MARGSTPLSFPKGIQGLSHFWLGPFLRLISGQLCFLDDRCRIALKYFSDLHAYRRREVTSWRHALPELSEVVPQILLKPLNRLPIHSSRSFICLHPFVGFPYHPFGNNKRLRLTHWFLPFLVDQSVRPDYTTPSLHPPYRTSSLLRVFCPCTPHRYSRSRGTST